MGKEDKAEMLIADVSMGRWGQTGYKQKEVPIQMATTHQALCVRGLYNEGSSSRLI